MQVPRRMMHSDHDWATGGVNKLLFEPFKPAAVETTEMAYVVLRVEQDHAPIVEIDCCLHEAFSTEYASKRTAIIMIAHRQINRQPNLRQNFA
ncbi:hypothetical protein ACVJBD_007616 [Rhizobium mongolense]